MNKIDIAKQECKHINNLKRMGVLFDPERIADKVIEKEVRELKKVVNDEK